VVYILSVVWRCLAVSSTGDLPYIYNDEFMYFDIAESLSGGEVMVRNQPVVYKYLLYPLILSPLFYLPDGIDIFRSIQFLNVIMMHSMIFPLYLLWKQLTGNKNAALAAALLSLLLPDTVIVKNIMTESLSFPMIFLALYFVCKMFCSPEKKSLTIISAVLCFLLFTIKPGYAAVAGACFFVMLFRAVKSRDKKLLPQPVLFATAVLLSLAVYTLILLAFGVNPFGETMYDKQSTPLSIEHLVLTLKGVLIYTHYHLIAFFIIPPIILIAGYKNRNETQKMFTQMLVITIILILTATVYIIYADETYNADHLQRIHLRYTAPFFPLILALLPTGTADKSRIRTVGIPVLAFLGVGLTFYDAASVAYSPIYALDSIMLSMMRYSSSVINGADTYLPILLSVLIPLTCLVLIHGFKPHYKKITLTIIIIVLIINQYAGYKIDSNNDVSRYSTDAAEIIKITGTNALMVADSTQMNTVSCAGIDIRSRAEIPIVTLNEILNATDENGVVSVIGTEDMNEFMNRQLTHSYNVGDYIILDFSVLRHLKLTEPEPKFPPFASYVYTPVSTGKPWISSVINGLEGTKVTDDTEFLLYDEAMREKDTIYLRLKVSSDSHCGSLVIDTADGHTQTFTVSDKSDWIDVYLTNDNNSAPLKLSFSAPDGEIYIDSYTIE
jgi:hypothetical protein